MRVLRQYDGIRKCPVCVPGRSYQRENKVTEQLSLESLGRYPSTFIPALAVPARGFLSNGTFATESGESFPKGITDAQATPAVSLHLLDILESQHRVGDVLVAREQREVIAGRHAATLLPGGAA